MSVLVLRVASWLLRLRGGAHGTCSMAVVVELAACSHRGNRRHVLRAQCAHHGDRRFLGHDILVRERVVVVASKVIWLLAAGDGRLQMLALSFSSSGWLRLPGEVRVAHTHVVDRLQVA